MTRTDGSRPSNWLKRLGLGLAFSGFLAFYYVGATEHARIVNTARARADQSGYLWDAVGIHSGRHGGPSGLIGERNRMPVYPWLLSWLYDPSMTPDEFFEVGKRWNIRLSLVLLGLLWLMVSRYLPPVASVSFVLVVAFGYFVFKAGYAQVELLYYTLFFVAFAACCHVLVSETRAAMLRWSAAAGVLTALTHLTKAAAIPLAGCLLAGLAAKAGFAVLARWNRSNVSAAAATPGALHDVVRIASAAAVFVLCLLAVLSPYLANSKRAFGYYFYNVNTTFYIWYDTWPLAAAGTYSHGDGVGWPDLPPSAIPTMRSYWQTHTVGQIGERLGDGLRDMIVVSYERLWYFKYVAMYLLFGAFVVASNVPAVRDAMRRRAALAVFLLIYGVVYVTAVAFYKPISGTTLRMLLAHIAPLLFVLSSLFWRTSIATRTWQVLRRPVGAWHFHLLVIGTVAFDVMFSIWGRLMRDFAGY